MIPRISFYTVYCYIRGRRGGAITFRGGVCFPERLFRIPAHSRDVDGENIILQCMEN